MTVFEIILLAFALSIDACIVSFSYGLTFNQDRIKNGLTISFFTGFFQALMPCIGYYLISLVKNYLEPFAPFLVFIIFTLLGLNIIRDAFKEEENKPNCISFICLLLIGIATSIDAFSAGISLSLSKTKLAMPVLAFGIITFINSYLGFSIAKKIHNIPKKKIEIFAGFILIVLGILALF